MIITRLQGGLGNQLFQYAVARVLADRCGQSLGLDLREMQDQERQKRAGDTPRPYLLERLNIRAEALTRSELFFAGYWQQRRAAKVLRMLGLNRGTSLKEVGPGFRALPEDPRGLYLDGYWQSWRYLEGGRVQLLKDLAPKKAASGKNAEMLKRMVKQNAVCVHVRRGDYVSLSAASAFHGLMGMDYYKAAIKRLGIAAKGATYYVFSDEPTWTKRNLHLPGTRVIVAHNSVNKPEEDLRLMSACRHFIIANSTLSWWAAWLGVQKAKKIVAPKQWFKGGPPTPDLCPPAWVRL